MTFHPGRYNEDRVTGDPLWVQHLDQFPDNDFLGVPYDPAEEEAFNWLRERMAELSRLALEPATVEDGSPTPSGALVKPSSPTPDPSPRRGARVPSSPRASGGDSGPASHLDVEQPARGRDARAA